MKAKAIFSFILTFIFIASITTTTLADVWVKGYYRKDGTYVRGHWRSNPDGNPYNNWSFPGNINPHTGKVATGNPDTYLDRYYDWTSTYEYYRSYHSAEEFNGWLKNMEKSKQFAEWFTQYKKEQERLKEKHRKHLFLLLTGIAIGYMLSQTNNSF